MKTGVFAAYWDTLLELADSKKAMIFLLGIVAIAEADSVGFEGVKACHRLAAAVALGAVWIICQTFVDIFGKADVPKTVAQKPVEPSTPKIGE